MKLYFLLLAQIFVIDVIWNLIWLSASKEYLLDLQGTAFKPKFWGLLIFYPLIAFGARLFVIPNIKKSRFWNDVITYGGVYGITVWGTWEFGNYITFTNWNIIGAFVSMIYGGLMISGVTGL